MDDGAVFFPSTRFSKSRDVSSIGPREGFCCIGEIAFLDEVGGIPSSCNFCVCCWTTLLSSSRITPNNRLNWMSATLRLAYTCSMLRRTPTAMGHNAGRISDAMISCPKRLPISA